MRALVIGRDGQLARALAERSANVPGLDVALAGRNLVDLAIRGEAAALVRARAPEIIINAAAYTAVDRAEDEPDLAMTVNRDGAGELAAAAAEVGAAIIHVSTDYVFPGDGTEPLTEAMPTGPRTSYGRSKLAGEGAVVDGNPLHLILRTAWVYSPFGNNFVRTMMSLAARQGTLRVVGDQRGNPTSALDLADAILAAVQAFAEGRRALFGATYHVAGTGSTSWAGFADAIMDECRALGLPGADIVPISSAEWPTKAQRPANSTLDSTHFTRAFGFTMPDWRTSLRPVVARIAGNP